MKNIISTIIMILIIIGIFGVLGIFGYILYDEVINIQQTATVEDFQTTFDDDTSVPAIENEIKAPEVIENSLNKIEGTNNGIAENMDYNNVNVDKYFYNQLEEYSKIIYRAFESNKENMKSGTYKIELGNTFSDILSQSNGQTLLGDYYQSAIEAYTYDNPDIFYLSPNKMYLNIETITTGNKVKYNVYINNGTEINYLSDEFSSKQQVDNAIAQLEQVKNSIIQNRTGNTYDDIKMVHDYLVDNVTYDTSISKPHIYNIYGALINKEAVCEGYARAFKYLLDNMNIPCVLVVGKATNTQGRSENHAWNYVQSNGRWYAVDTTWDDPVVVGGGTASQSSKYKYFMKSASEFNVDHFANGQFTEGGEVFSYPEI